MKKFSEVRQGDTVYFLIDTCGILNGTNSIGFANSNYGLIICSRMVTSDRWEWHNPRSDSGLLFTLRIDTPIMKGDICLLGPHINEYGRESESLMSITKEMGRESCIKKSFGYLYTSYSGYIFTTKEALEEKIKEVTSVVEENLRKINKALSEL